jgi:hypothetical protein
MKNQQIIITLMITTLIFGISTSGYALNVTPTGDAETLVNEILGPGVTLVPSSATYTGANTASGTFVDGASSGINIESGIILTSGTATDAVGPNQNGAVPETLGGGGSSDDTTTVLGLGGDADLTTLAGFNTFDATVLEFRFTTASKGDLAFNFVFASEEYIDYVNTQFNDVFGFFVDGVNIGLVPGTTDPITINTINANVNSAFFNQNISVSPPPSAPFDIEYDGFTTVITAQLLDLSAGEHTMKLAIADGSDYILDASVFIEAGSFQIAGIEVPVDVKPTSCPNPINFGGKGVLPVAILGTVEFDVTQVDPASVTLAGVSPLRWSYEDVATPYEPFMGKEDCFACNEEGLDGFMDLTLKFKTQEIVAAMGNAWRDGDCAQLVLQGMLVEEFGSIAIIGEDYVWLRIKK